jgi:tetratricopeptide (TPR) repeat protein
MPPERRVDVKYGLVRASGGEANWKEVQEILSDANQDIREIIDKRSRLEKRFEFLNWKLKAASRGNDCSTASRIRDRIERLRNAAQRTGKLSAIADVTSRCSLAAFELFYGSAGRGLRLLSGTRLHSTIPVHLVLRVRLLSGLGYQRMGEWDKAEYESRRALKLAEKSNDTLQLATVLTNLACTSIERGQWDEAEEYMAKATKLHQALKVAVDVAIPMQLNAANLAFYSGRVRDAKQAYLDVYRRAQRNGVSEFKSELEACLGLVTLQLRDPAEALRWESLCETEEASVEGIQERFKIEWFWAFMNRHNDPDAVRARLHRVAESQEAVDRISALKLKWLVRVLLPSSRKEPSQREQNLVREELTTAGLGWFVHFSERWMRLASSNTL